MIWCGHGAASGWPRRRLFAAVRSAARTAQIGRAAVVLRKTPLSFRKSTHAPDVLSEFFTKNASYYFQINAQSRPDGHWFVCKKDLHFSENQLALPRHSRRFFAKTSSDFSQIEIQPNFDYIFFPSKKYVWPVDRAHGRARKTSNIMLPEFYHGLETSILVSRSHWPQDGSYLLYSLRSITKLILRLVFYR